jgi:uncharacterized protein YqhQ
MLILMLSALGLLIMAGIIHLILAHVRFADRFSEVEALLPDATFIEGMLMLTDLAKLAWHHSHNDKVKQLYAYHRGKHGVDQNRIVV